MIGEFGCGALKCRQRSERAMEIGEYSGDGWNKVSTKALSYFHLETCQKTFE
jgi:hypothetical protein